MSSRLVHAVDEPSALVGVDEQYISDANAPR
jgi:hypothetical protein